MTALHQARGSAVTDHRCAAELCIIAGCDKVDKRIGRKGKLIEKENESTGMKGCLKSPTSNWMGVTCRRYTDQTRRQEKTV